MILSTKIAQSDIRKIIAVICFLIIVVSFSRAQAQNSEIYTLTAEALQNDETVELNKVGWKYQSGDDLNWANPQFDDSGWEKLEETVIKPQNLPKSGWNGRAWFRLHLQVDESLRDKTLALVGTQRGASEIYLDGRKIAEFGKITDTEISEYNPNRLPITFRFDTTGEHVLAVRFASQTFSDFDSKISRWLMNTGLYPSFHLTIVSADDVAEIISQYANLSSMRIGFLFIGVLLALALLHFLLYIFYRVERANLFYSIYAASFAFFVLFNNVNFSGHQPILATVILRELSTLMLAATFISLLAFLHIAFKRAFGKMFWIFAALWIAVVVLHIIGQNSIWANILIGLTFTYCIWILIEALRAKSFGAWILMIGVQMLMFGMTISLLASFRVVNLPGVVSTFGDLGIILGVPVAVSVFLARNFAGTNRNLKNQLEQVEILSKQQIEQERRTAELHAENERRAKELEEAKQLQLSMLPKKLPVIPNLEIAAYMKPTTEVGGDYYDFHVGDDGTLTVAVGDATGHGLKAGTVVTATKSLFNNLADAPDIPDTLRQISRSLKTMNLRGLFMALTLIKLKDNSLSVCAAGMPSTLIYRAETKTVEEISIRAMPLGSITKFAYRQIDIVLQTGDVVVVMSDGFPEMFNAENEMLGFDKAAEVLREIATHPPQEIIDRFVEVSRNWSGDRPADDDVTFVVLKIV